MAQAANGSASLPTIKSSPAVISTVPGGFSPPAARVMSKSAREVGTLAEGAGVNLSSNFSATVTQPPHLESKIFTSSAATSASTSGALAAITASSDSDAQVRTPSATEVLIDALRSPDQKQFDQVFKRIKQAAAQGAKTLKKPSVMGQLVAQKLNGVVDVPELTWGPTTPLIAAVRGNKLHCLNLLLEVGADPNLLAGESGTALMFAKDLDCAKALLKAGANPNLAAPHRETVLIHAVSADWDRKVIQALLDHQADVNQLAVHPSVALSLGMVSQRWPYLNDTKILHLEPLTSPLIVAAVRGNDTLINLLIEAGADLECKAGPMDYTPLMVAVSAKKPEAVAALLTAGANLAAVDKEGNTPLHLASSRGFAAIMQDLLRAGADRNAVNGNEKTAMMIVQDGLVSPTWAAKERLDAAKQVLLQDNSNRST